MIELPVPGWLINGVLGVRLGKRMKAIPVLPYPVASPVWQLRQVAESAYPSSAAASLGLR